MDDGQNRAPYVEAGLLGEGSGDERRELLDFLAERGCSLDEMVDADRRGRLFGLAGDRIIRPAARTLTLTEVADRTEGDEAVVRRIWRALGLAGWEGDEPVASPDEAEALRVMVGVVSVAGEDLALDLARSMGASLARIAEATNVIGRLVSPDSTLDTSAGEVATARFWADIAPVLPALGDLLGVFIRHHFDLAREHFERSGSADLMHRRLTRLAVGFIDMSGFTTATEQLGEVEFARLMSSFSTEVDQTVRDLDGRVVKFVGDAAMIVAADAEALATIAQRLVEAWSTGSHGLTLHAGLAHGELLSQDGDYFGRAVNIAARLVGLADPGTILATADVGEALAAGSWRVAWNGPTPIRGIDEPVTTCSVWRSSAADR
jgi:class 3 adenylate cyclase